MFCLLERYPKYEIDKNGVVRQADSKYVLKQGMNNSGYLTVELYDCEGRLHCERVHRLVAETFIPNPENKPYVNHIDECYTHNSVDNLEWVTPKENSNHGTRNERIVKSRLKGIIAVDLYGRVIGKYRSNREATESLGIADTSIGRVIKDNCIARKIDIYFISGNDIDIAEVEMNSYLPSLLLKANNIEDGIVAFKDGKEIARSVSATRLSEITGIHCSSIISGAKHPSLIKMGYSFMKLRDVLPSDAHHNNIDVYASNDISINSKPNETALPDLGKGVFNISNIGLFERRPDEDQYEYETRLRAALTVSEWQKWKKSGLTIVEWCMNSRDIE